MGRMVDGLALVGEFKEVRWGEREEGVWVFSMLGMGMAQESEEMPAVVRSCLSWSVVRPLSLSLSPAHSRLLAHPRPTSSDFFPAVDDSGAR